MWRYWMLDKYQLCIYNILYIIHEISYYPIFIGDTSHLFVSG